MNVAMRFEERVLHCHWSLKQILLGAFLTSIYLEEAFRRECHLVERLYYSGWIRGNATYIHSCGYLFAHMNGASIPL